VEAARLVVSMETTLQRARRAPHAIQSETLKFDGVDHMASEISKTQIDRLGERLKKGNITEADLRLLDQYRRSFTEAYEVVVGAIRKELALEPTGRPAKSTTSISEKLRRESIRLTQIQDIAGCRLIVTDIASQDAVVQSLTGLFEDTTIVDRRQKPSHGYRAVHVVVNYGGKMIEIQVRTSLQHLWAELSEKLSDVFNPAIKYGGGAEDTQKALTDVSSIITLEEGLEHKFAERISLSLHDKLTDKDEEIIAANQERLMSFRRAMFEMISDIIRDLEVLKGEKDVLPD